MQTASQPIMVQTKLRASDSQNALLEGLADFLEECILETELQKIPGFDSKSEVKIGYSLSYSQGDGVCFTGGEIELTRENPIVSEIIELARKELNISEANEVNFHVSFSHRGHYYHENSFSLSVRYNFLDANGKEYTQDDSQKDYSDMLLETFRDICKTLEKRGYEYIDAENIESICYTAFERYKKENDIESDTSLVELQWSHSKDANHEGMTHIAISGDTTIDGLWVKLPNIETHTRIVVYHTFS